jgi:hypothetical protein
MMASTASKQTRTNGERGQALLEMLPIMVLMLTLAFAVVDFGRAIWQQEVITGLTREGSNVASRTTGVDLPTALAAGVTAVINDGAPLNLGGSCPHCGAVIITAVQNTVLPSGVQAYVMIGQAHGGNLFGGNPTGMSKIGAYVSGGTNIATLSAESLPGVTVQIPQPGSTVYVTEVFDSYAPITPIASFMRITLPANLYDAAYF